MNKYHFSYWLSAAALMLLGAGCGAEAGSAPPVPGNPAPAYAAPALGGDTVALADLRGQPVLLNIWATWCPPCREEMPALEALHQSYKADGLQVVGVSVDARSAAPEVRRFLDERGITFPILHDPDERVARAFRTTGVPETFLIGRDGTIAQRWIGEIDAESPEVQSAVREALGLGAAGE